MPRMKIAPHSDGFYTYSTEHWEILNSLRNRAIEITKIFQNHQIDVLIYGSVARGDVKATSDVDIVIIPLLPSYRMEMMLEECQIPILGKRIIQATPNDVIKAHYELESNTTITLLLTKFTQTPFEFYKFGGAVSYDQLRKQIRVAGVDKRLVLILPTSTGHEERALIENQNIAAKELDISISMIQQRIRVLTRRDKIGRTGVFLNDELAVDQNIEEYLYNLARTNHFIRRRLRMN